MILHILLAIFVICIFILSISPLELVRIEKIGYDSLFQGEKPLLDRVIEHEVNKYSLGSIKKAYSYLGWKPNQNIEKLMIETMKQNMEIIK